MPSACIAATVCATASGWEWGSLLTESTSGLNHSTQTLKQSPKVYKLHSFRAGLKGIAANELSQMHTFLHIELWLFKTSSLPKCNRLDLVRSQLSCAVRRYPRRRMARVAMTSKGRINDLCSIVFSDLYFWPGNQQLYAIISLDLERNPTLLHCWNMLRIIYWHIWCSGHLFIFISHLQSSFWPIPSASLCALLEPRCYCTSGAMTSNMWCGWSGDSRVKTSRSETSSKDFSKVPGHKMRWKGFAPGWFFRKGVRTQPAMALSRSGQ